MRPRRAPVPVPARARARRGGFTLMEVAVTIVIVGIALVMVMQGLNTAKLTAAHTRNLKLARELGLLTLSQVESGLFREELDERFEGSYAEEGHVDFTYEVLLGDEAFRERTYEDEQRFDSWQPTETELEEEEERDEDEEIAEPYEKVKVRVLYPKFGEYPSELILETWVPWEQVYGAEDEEEDGATAAAAEGPR